MKNLIRKVKKASRNYESLLQGLNIYVDREKIGLIRYAFENVLSKPNSFADLGGVWKVDAGYTIFTLKNYPIQKAFLVDTNYNDKVDRKLKEFSQLAKIEGNFAQDSVIDRIERVDAVYFFDVLLHQVNPNWDVILEKYSAVSDCFIIYNQQFIGAEKTIRLMDLPLDKYRELAPRRKDGLYDFIYSHKEEINPEHNRPWKDIHNVWQWGITDGDLRATMRRLGYREVYYKNWGRFSNLKAFQNHAFIFKK